MKKYLLILLVAVLPILTSAQSMDLFMSEYVEGSSNNKALEIYNGTGSEIDLSEYTIDIYANGGTTFSTQITLAGTIADGDVFVVVHPSASDELLAYADMTGNCYWNGNDAIVLAHFGDPVDRIGQVGVDPGSEWGTGDVTTANHTLRRMDSVTDGDTDIYGDYDPAMEWNGFPIDTFDGLGWHINQGSSEPQITNVSRTPTIPDASQNTVITCDVTETAKTITVVQLLYNVNNTPNTTVTMTNTSGNSYSGEIPASAYTDGDLVEYYIHAENNTGEEDNTIAYKYLAGTTSMAQIHEYNDNGELDFQGVDARAQGDATVEDGTYSTSSLQVYFQDATAGLNIYKGGTTTTFSFGRIYEVTGTIDQYNGLAELVPFDLTTDVVDVGTGTTPEPLVMTIAEFLAGGEVYEGMLIGIQHVVHDGGDAWPASGSNANLTIADGTGSMTMRIDKDTDIDENPEPTWPMDVVGIFTQYDNSAPYLDGYQILPRGFQDFLPDGSLPVELTTFSASVDGESVTLHWETASELNNKGFEVERKSANSTWSKITFVEGHGTTTEKNVYSYADASAKPNGVYYYRLKQIDNDGTFCYSSIVEVEVNNIPNKYSLEQNYPNPFNPSTVIKYSLPEKGFVTLKVYDVLGNEVASLVSDEKEAGSYEVSFDASQLTSGIYVYSLQVNNFRATKKMMLLK